jgi:hypothetical protein
MKQRAYIDERHKKSRRQFLQQYRMGPNPDNRQLVEAGPEFGHLPFTTHDLYDLYLCDFIKTMPEAYREALKLPGGMLRSIAQAHATATAQMVLLVYLCNEANIDEH